MLAGFIANQNMPSPDQNDPAAGLNESDLDPNPIQQFDRWLKQAEAANLPEPTAMTLATATKEGIPSARIVLLKACDERGFAFFTNYESPKGRELAENPRAALVFHWVVLERQVRVTGTVSRASREESAQYFQSRPRGSRIGAWASHQSQAIRSREELEERVRRFTLEYQDREEIPLPPYWGGFWVTPDAIEFWQGRPSRLHDRFRYTRLTTGGWRIDRLSP